MREGDTMEGDIHIFLQDHIYLKSQKLIKCAYLSVQEEMMELESEMAAAHTY